VEKRPLAVVTMAYNEATMLPLWLRHYERQVGPENCYVLDHGSSDGSTRAISANVIRLPRLPLNEWERALAVRDFCASLFIGFRYVLFTDADELVLPDPDVAATLPAYIGGRELPPVVDLFGADVRHVDDEAAIDLAEPISKQRRYVRPISTLCKATLISERVDWHIGFHCLIQDHRPTFRDLFLFHLAHCDNDIMFARQQKRNSAAPIGIPNSHHAIEPAMFLHTMRMDVNQIARRRVQMWTGESSFEATKKTFADAIEAKTWAQAPELWQLPDRFVGTF
jgi:glycosyltransferase involved in cell wall biosynthesis